jgi:hypothetical protein
LAALLMNVGGDNTQPTGQFTLEPVATDVGERWSDRAHVGVGLAVDQAREAIQPRTPNAHTLFRILLVEIHPDGQREWPEALADEVVVKALAKGTY